MRLHHLVLSAVALAAMDVVPCQIERSNQQIALLPYSQTSLCVTTSIGTCGSVCEPFQCEPNYTIASSGETLYFDIHSTPGTPFVLFFGIPVPSCQPVPGLAGELGLFAPIITVQIDSVSAPVANWTTSLCEVGAAQTQIQIPNAIPPGTDSRFQVLGMNSDTTGQIQIGFSRATEVRCR